MTGLSATTGRRTKLNLKERRHELLCEELSELAFDLFAERGFDQTTVDDVAQAAGISRRTFFRYFKTKEDVVLRRWDDMCDRLEAALTARPKREPPIVATLRALQTVMTHYAANADRTRRLRRLCCETPSLLAHRLEKQVAWRACIAKAVAARMPARARKTFVPQLVAAVAIGAFDVAADVWQDGDDLDLLKTLDTVFASLPKVVAGVADSDSD